MQFKTSPEQNHFGRRIERSNINEAAVSVSNSNQKPDSDSLLHHFDCRGTVRKPQSPAFFFFIAETIPTFLNPFMSHSFGNNAREQQPGRRNLDLMPLCLRAIESQAAPLTSFSHPLRSVYYLKDGMAPITAILLWDSSSHCGLS